MKKNYQILIDESSPLYEICRQAKSKNHAEHFNNLINTESTSATTISSSDNEQNLLDKSIKNEDYEIVVILEGNIETTGASCHIRTSYLPQEILFGYRFTPIYPKFTDFEYLFDYSKFDQVEPFQYELLNLNVAFTNPLANRVYDARSEEKNYNLTFNNTLQKEEKPTRTPMSLVSILSTFKIHQNDGNSKQKMPHRHDTKQQSRKSTININETKNLNHDSIKKITNNGRFTICPVEQQKPVVTTAKLNRDKLSASLITMNVNENTSTQKISHEKRPNQLSKQVLFQMHYKKQASAVAHFRTNSLPPFHPSESNEDEGYLTSNKINSKEDLN